LADGRRGYMQLGSGARETEMPRGGFESAKGGDGGQMIAHS